MTARLVLSDNEYLKLDASNDPLTGTLTCNVDVEIDGDLYTDNIKERTGSANINVHNHVFPATPATYDMGDASNSFRTVFLGNDGGNIIECPNASGSPTEYIIWGGGGGTSGGGGTLKVQFANILGTGSENAYVIDFGVVDYASSVHHYIFQSTGNVALIGDVKVSTEFGGALGPGNIGFKFENTGTYNYRNTIDSAMGSPFLTGWDPQSGDRWRKTMSFYMDGQLQYEYNYSSAGWHGFEMNPNNLSPSGNNYALVYINTLTDQLSANRNSRAGLRVLAPATNLNGFTLSCATNIHIAAQSTVGTYNAGIFMANSSKVVLSNGSTGGGPAMWGIQFGADILVNEPNEAATITTPFWHLVLPGGTSQSAEYRAYNQSNIIGFTYSFYAHGVNAAVAKSMVSQFGAPTSPITDLDIGSDASATSFVDINFKFLNVTEYNMSATAFTLSDANNIVVGTGTGTKIATSTSQKIAFYNSTPIIQPSSTGETVGFTVGTGTGVNDDSTFTGNVGLTAYRISDIVKHLKNLGLIAS